MAQSRKSEYWKLWLASTLTIAGTITFVETPTLAQITPDHTLGVEQSKVTPNVTIKGLPAALIDGGAGRGRNLFHSFLEFNINEGRGAYFKNPNGIQNIFSRVTGESLSNILGTLGVLGNANLFVINPNGIIFGPNASLDLGGSFVATTANAVQFGNQGFFSASEPNAPPLLTINPSALLFNQLNAGRIENRSIAPAGLDSFKSPLSGLRVPDGRSLLFVGGDIVIDGGGRVHTDLDKTDLDKKEVKEVVNAGLHALDGRIELGGVAELGTVGLDFLDDQGNLLRLSFPDALVRADLLLTNRALIDARATNPNLSAVGKGIQLQGRRVELTSGTQVVTNTQTSQKAGDIFIRASQLIVEESRISTIAGDPNSRMTGNAGSLTVNATESMELNGGARTQPLQLMRKKREIQRKPLESGLFTQTNGTGNSGEVLIETGRLIVQNGAEISTSANDESKGNAGLLTVTSRELVEVIGKDSKLTTQSDGSGDAGNLTVKTRQLIAQDGGRLQTNTLGRGQAGMLSVKATESVEVRGRGTDGFNSSLSTAAQENFTEETGDGGDMMIETGRLSVLDGGRVTTSTVTNGNAGNLTINTGQMIVGGVLGGDEARVTTFTSGQGKPGSISIKADSVSLFDNGLISAAVSPRAVGDVERQGGNIEIQTRTLSLTNKAQILARNAQRGRAGNLTVTTGEMTIENGAQVSVSSPKGQAGNIDITANSLSMNRGTVAAETGQSQDEQGGANIKLQVSDLLLMENESTISALALNNANGGNIDIDARFVIALPNQNNDIIANAQEKGEGGNIEITTEAIFGLTERSSTPENSTNDIDASSEFGLDGRVSINTPEVDPSQGLTELPEVSVNVEVAQGCQTGGKQASIEFFNTGRGGLAPSPYEPLSSSNIWEDVPPPIPESEKPDHEKNPSVSSNKIVQAQGWIIDEKGRVILVAQKPTLSSQGRCRLH